MIRYLHVLSLALVAMTGCTTTSYHGRTAAFEGSLWGQDSAVRLAQVDVAQRRLDVAEKTGGCVQESRYNMETGYMETAYVTTGGSLCGSYGYGFGGGAYGPAANDPLGPYVAAAQQNVALRSAAAGTPSVYGGGGSDGTLAVTVDALGKRVEGIETTVGEIKEDVRVIATMHAPDPAPIQTK